MTTAQLLLVEEQGAQAQALAQHLRGAGYRVVHAVDGRPAIELLQTQPWDLVLLALPLPGAQALNICGHLRDSASPVPLIVLSAQGGEGLRVLALELGADDFLTTPLSMLELTARVRALLRRVQQLRRQPSDAALQVGGLRIELASRHVHLRGVKLNLTLREFDLLHFLVRHAGDTFSRGELLQRVWGAGFDGDEHTVCSHINRLRGKLVGEAQNNAQNNAKTNDHADPSAFAAPMIETVWGFGYRFKVQPPHPTAASVR